MEVHLTPDQEAFVRQGIESGWYHSHDDVIAEALALWEERERKRAAFRSSLEEAKNSIARGEGRAITGESVKQLAGEVKQRGQARLEAKHSSSR